MNGHWTARDVPWSPFRSRHQLWRRIHPIEVWIDTGFNGELVLPQQRIDDLALRSTGTTPLPLCGLTRRGLVGSFCRLPKITRILADGSEILMQRYFCLIDWFSEVRELEVIANEGNYPLLGVGLLEGHDLHISYRSGVITIL